MKSSVAWKKGVILNFRIHFLPSPKQQAQDFTWKQQRLKISGADVECGDELITTRQSWVDSPKTVLEEYCYFRKIRLNLK